MNNSLIILDDQQSAISIPLPLDQNPAYVYIGSLPSAHSKRNMSRYLNQMAKMLDSAVKDATVFRWELLRSQHTEAIRARLSQQYAPATVNNMLAALRGVLGKAWKLGYMSAEDYHRAIDIKGVKGETLPAGRDLADGEIRSLVAACYADKNENAGYRDAAIIALLQTCGMRRAEVATLKIQDIDVATRKISIKRSKGGKSRTVFAPVSAMEAVKDWLVIRGGRGDEPLFTAILKSGKIITGARKAGKNNAVQSGITAQTIYEMLVKRGKQAKVKDFSPHDFRRTFAGEMLDNGADIVTVANIMGHANVETTRRYDRRPEEAKKTAADKMHFPHQRRKG